MKQIFKYFLQILAFAGITFFLSGCQINNFEVVVKNSQGALLKGATVYIGDKTTAKTDKEGVAKVSAMTYGSEIVIKAKKDGFITQTIVVELKKRQKDVKAQIILKALDEVITVENIQDAQTINGSKLGAKVSLPENSLVTPSGQVAQGEVSLYLTPWDIRENDLLAMPGNAQAIDSNGDEVELISAGMMTIDFYDENGNYLQLAEGKTAQIQMDLVQYSINNIAINIGDTIPLWHFDEDKGLWIEDGVGQVISSASSPVGMALVAEVSHFSTWNWDFKFENPGSVFVQCQLSDGTEIACDIVADVQLDDGSHFTKSKSISQDGTTVINMPTSATIQWNGSTSEGLIGTTTSGTSGDVIIVLDEPITSNFIQCQLIDGTAVSCYTSLTNPYGDNLNFTIPEDGATIKTYLEGVSSLTWTAKSYTLLEEDELVHYEGETTSSLSDDVTISLANRVVEGNSSDEILLMCTNPNNTQNLNTCNIVVYNNLEVTIAEYNDIPIGSTVVLNLPSASGNDYFYIDAYSGNYGGFWRDYTYEELESKKGEIIELPIGYFSDLPQ